MEKKHRVINSPETYSNYNPRAELAENEKEFDAMDEALAYRETLGEGFDIVTLTFGDDGGIHLDFLSAQNA